MWNLEFNLKSQSISRIEMNQKFHTKRNLNSGYCMHFTMKTLISVPRRAATKQLFWCPMLLICVRRIMTFLWHTIVSKQTFEKMKIMKINLKIKQINQDIYYLISECLTTYSTFGLQTVGRIRSSKFILSYLYM